MSSNKTNSVKEWFLDPTQQPWVAADDDLPAFGPNQLSLDFLKDSFSSDHKWREDNYIYKWNDEKRQAGGLNNYIKSSVLVPLINIDDKLHVILTVRSRHLKQHSGQICFPGGRIETTDKSPADAALRETYEEIGITPDKIEIFGEMPQFITGTGFIMYPFIACVDKEAILECDSNEVEEVIYVPLDYLMSPANYRLYTVEPCQNLIRNYYGLDWDGYFVWGATAAILRNIYQKLRQNAL